MTDDDKDIGGAVKAAIRQVAEEQSIPVATIEDHHAIVDDLGFKSLDISTLVVLLEQNLGVDPFSSFKASLTDIRTVADVVSIYERCLAGTLEDEPHR